MWKLWESHKEMSGIWIGCIVMGLAYLLAFYDGSYSPAFIIGQVVLGSFGLLRELHLNKHGFAKN
ncbi:hypothetical protein AAFX24_28295 [Vibrio mediterranei]|uniref:hypothetical protein n=1 Tax=Vibrio mediterranei TaxID=689 RepID=UPI0038CF094B